MCYVHLGLCHRSLGYYATRRKNKTDRSRFLTSAKIKDTGNFFYYIVRRLRNRSGNSRPNGSVVVNPGVRYLRPVTLSRFVETMLSDGMDDMDLIAARLDDLAGVLASMVLGTVIA